MFIKASSNLWVLLFGCFFRPLLSCSAWSHFFGKAFSWLPAAKHGKGVLLVALHADVFCFVPKGNPLGTFGPWCLKNRPGVSQCNVRFQIPPRTETLLFVEPAMLRGGLGKASPCSGIFGQQHSHHRKAHRCGDASHLFRAPAGTSARSRAQRQVQPYLFWRKAAGRRQGASFQAGQPGAGANGAGIDQCFPVSPPLCARSFAEAVAFSCIARIACFRCDCPGNRAATLQKGSAAWYNKRKKRACRR